MATDGLLPLFKEQLERECESLGLKHAITDRGHKLLWWYFARLHGMPEADIRSIICDSAGDLGLDAIWIDRAGLVHFYQFKNPEDPRKGIKAGDVDKVLSGLRLILHRKHDQIANGRVRQLVEEIYKSVPIGYRLHFVSSGEGLPHESKVKLAAFIDELQGPPSFFDWEEVSLKPL